MQTHRPQHRVEDAVLTMEHGSTSRTLLPRSIRIVASSALRLSADRRGLPGPASGTHSGAGEEPAAKQVELDAIQGLKTRAGYHAGLTEAKGLLQPTEDAVRPPTCSALSPTAATVPSCTHCEQQ